MSLGKAILRGHPELEVSTTPSTEARSRRRHDWEIIFVCLLIFTATVTPYGTRRYFSHLLPTGPLDVGPAHRNPAYLIKAKHAAVASENGLCSKLGVQILKDGGNAVDSAVGTTFCIGVVNMFS
jgi:gamma-glutamyltranspeptidase/glutathione hydrolase/leukotriene-C4 hydrolase